MHFLAALLERQRRPAAGHEGLGRSPLRYRSARDAAYGADGITHTPIYLARAEGNAFRVITRL
jgi:hypothetical protein